MLRSYTAVFAASDYYAIDLIHFLNEQEIKVPEDISVIGFDDTTMTRFVYPTLTTVSQDVELRAKIAIEKLNELKEHKEIDTTVMLPVKLVVRGSSRKLEDVK